MHQYRLFGDHGHFSKQGRRDALRVDVHIRRTSKKQLEEVLQKENAEIWGYRTKMGAVPRSPSLLGEVVAVVIICDTDEVSGTIEMLSVLPEYMGLGLSSALIRHSEYILHKAKKRVMKMKVFIPRSTDPVIYTAVSDPVSAGLAKEDKTPEGNITGTADTLPVEAQLKMIREVLPDATKIGILYTTSEANSLSTIETYKELADDYGFEIVESGINTLADVDMAAADLAAKVDCISNLTDNTVVQGLQTVLAKASAAGIPVFGSEVEQVKNGCLAAEGIDYVALGKQTGAMAAKVLKGEAEASDMPYEACEGANLYINTEVASDLGITFPENYEADAAEVFETVTVE